MDVDWTEARIETLTTSWADGKSAAQIAREFGDCTRAAVSGKLLRLGLTAVSEGRSGPPMGPPIKHGRRRRKPAAEQVEDGPPNDLPVEPIPSDEDFIGPRKPLVALNKGECHWPIGDPREPEFGFCGNPVVPKQSYCLRHCHVAYDFERTEWSRSV